MCVRCVHSHPSEGVGAPRSQGVIPGTGKSEADGWEPRGPAPLPKAWSPFPSPLGAPRAWVWPGLKGQICPPTPAAYPRIGQEVGAGDRQAEGLIPPPLQPDSCGPIKINSSQVFLVMTQAQKASLPLGLFLKNLELFKFYSPTTSNPGRK